MKILVTGSSGMLGSDLGLILSKDHELSGMDMKEAPSGASPYRRYFKADITQEAEVKDIIAEAKPDVVIHAAAWTDVDGCELDPVKAEDANTFGTRNVAEAAEAVRAPLIFISTDFVFDGKKTTPYTEEDKAGPINVYGRTKCEAEKIIMERSSAYAIVRTSWLFGEHGRNFADTITRKAANGEKLYVVNDQVGSPTYAHDLSIAIGKLLEKDLASGREIFHVSNGGKCSWYEFAREIVELTIGNKSAVRPITSLELDRPAKRPAFSVMDNKKFMKAAGCAMRPWKDALIEYLKKKGNK